MYKLLEYVVCTLNFTPVPELEMLGAAITSRTLAGDSLPLRTLIKLVNFDPRYASAPLVCGERGGFVCRRYEHTITPFPHTWDSLYCLADVARELNILNNIIAVLRQLLQNPTLRVRIERGVEERMCACLYRYRQMYVCTCG